MGDEKDFTFTIRVYGLTKLEGLKGSEESPAGFVKQIKGGGGEESEEGETTCRER